MKPPDASVRKPPGTQLNIFVRWQQRLNIHLSLLWFYLRRGSYIGRTLLIISMAAVVIGVYQFGYFSAEHRYRSFSTALDKTLAELGLVVKASPINVNLAILKREFEISRNTIIELKNVIYENSLQLDRLKEQIYFYQSIVAPEDIQEGLSIFDINVSDPLGAGQYPIEIILKQSKKEGRLINGHVSISVYGKDEGDKNSELINEDLKFSFRYFQRIRSVLIIPTEFRPEKVLVSIAAGKTLKFERTYSWEEITQGI